MPVRRNRGRDYGSAGHSTLRGVRSAQACSRKEDARHLPRPRHVHRRHSPARRAGRSLRAQPDGARAPGGRSRKLAGRPGCSPSPISARSTSSKRGPSSPPTASAPTPALADERCALRRAVDRRLPAPAAPQAEDLADQVNVELEELPAVVDCVAAMQPGSPRLFDLWPDNAFITSMVSASRCGSAAGRADPAAPPVSHEPAGHRAARMPRRRWPTGTTATTAGSWCTSPRKVAARDAVLGLSQALGLPEHQGSHVIAPDVGGGFGGKNPPDAGGVSRSPPSRLKVGHRSGG